MANIPGATSDDNHRRAVDSEATGHHGSEPPLGHALRPIVDEVQRQIAQTAREQANLAVAPARQAMSPYVDRLLDELQSTARQQVARALEPVIDSLLDHVDEALAPARTTLNNRVDEILNLLLYGYGRPEVSPDVTGTSYHAHELPAPPAEDVEKKAQPARKKKATRSASRSAAKEDSAKTARSSTRTSQSKRSAGQSSSRTTRDLPEAGTSHDAASDRDRGKDQASKKRSTQGRASSSRKRTAKQES